MRKKKLCEWFGHKWQPVCIIKKGVFKLVGVYCERCWFGHDELIDFVGKNRPIINSYSFKYWEGL